MENENKKESMLNKVYTLVSSETHESIKILGGSYFEGIQYAYGKIQFIPDEKGNASLDFEYMIEDNPNGVDLQKYENEFSTLMGDILVDVIDLKYANKPVRDDELEEYELE